MQFTGKKGPFTTNPASKRKTSMSLHKHVKFTDVKFNILAFQKSKMSRCRRDTKTLVVPIWPIRQVSTEHTFRGAANMHPQHSPDATKPIFDVAPNAITVLGVVGGFGVRHGLAGDGILTCSVILWCGGAH